MWKAFPKQNMNLRYHTETNGGFDLYFAMPYMAKGNLNRLKR